MFVIKRIDQSGGYVAPSGQASSYTTKLERARVYDTREAAEADRCEVNEQVVELRDCLWEVRRG